jgi:hypothetical protein
MSIAKIGLTLVLVDFVALSLWAVVTGGGLGALVALLSESPWALQIGCDLVLALAMVSFFVWKDARARDRNPIPWVVATVITGSIAPLFYFVLRPSETEADAGAASAGAAVTGA